MLALMELNVSLYDFFDGAVYDQPVKTKTKQNSVEIINENNFYLILKERGVRKKDTPHDNLSKFLQLDANYPGLLMLKKIAKTLDEMANNEELMQNIISAAEENMGGEEDERLNTIGEDEEDRQFDTNKGTTVGAKTKPSEQRKVEEEDNYDDDDYEF